MITTFQDYMQQVNKLLQETAGVGIEVFDNYPFYQDYIDGKSPIDTAKIVLESDGCPTELLDEL